MTLVPNKISFSRTSWHNYTIILYIFILFNFINNIYYLSESFIKNIQPISNSKQPATKGLLIGFCFIASNVNNIQPIVKLVEPKK